MFRHSTYLDQLIVAFLEIAVATYSLEVGASADKNNMVFGGEEACAGSSWKMGQLASVSTLGLTSTLF